MVKRTHKTVERGLYWHLRALRRECGSAIVDDRVRSFRGRVELGFSSYPRAQHPPLRNQIRRQDSLVSRHSDKQSVVVLCLADRGGIAGRLVRWSGKIYQDWRCEGKSDCKGYEETDLRGRESLEIEADGSTVHRMVYVREEGAGQNNPW
jgi:hypothetical protein